MSISRIYSRRRKYSDRVRRGRYNHNYEQDIMDKERPLHVAHSKPLQYNGTTHKSYHYLELTMHHYDKKELCYK